MAENEPEPSTDVSWFLSKNMTPFPDDMKAWQRHLVQPAGHTGQGTKENPFLFDNGDTFHTDELVQGQYWFGSYQFATGEQTHIMRYYSLEVPKSLEDTLCTRIHKNMRIHIPFTTEDYLNILERRRHTPRAD